MWDLRNSVSPIKEFLGHAKGVLGLAWSMHDSSLLLSSSKDSRTICWDVHSAEMVCEMTSTPHTQVGAGGGMSLGNAHGPGPVLWWCFVVEWYACVCGGTAGAGAGNLWSGSPGEDMDQGERGGVITHLCHTCHPPF